MAGPSKSLNRPQPRTAAQQRVIDAAEVLFSEHGVGGTSLQMIADTLGVTKAAVYYQFSTKEQIVAAVTEAPIARLAAAIEAAEAADTPEIGRIIALWEMVNLTVQQREIVIKMHGDPEMARFIYEDRPFRRLMDRLYKVLSLGDTSASARLRSATVTVGLANAAAHPIVDGVRDDELRDLLFDLACDVLCISPEARMLPSASDTTPTKRPKAQRRPRTAG